MKAIARILACAGSALDISGIFSSFGGSGIAANGVVSGEGRFTITGTELRWTAVPEPSGTLAGLLVAAGLLRRRRENTQTNAGRMP